MRMSFKDLTSDPKLYNRWVALHSIATAAAIDGANDDYHLAFDCLVDARRMAKLYDFFTSLDGEKMGQVRLQIDRFGAEIASRGCHPVWALTTVKNSPEPPYASRRSDVMEAENSLGWYEAFYKFTCLPTTKAAIDAIFKGSFVTSET